MTRASVLRALVLYDRRRSGLRAKELFDRLTAQSGGRLSYELELYRFDLLARDALAAAALREAARSDLIVVAMGSGRSLPRPVEAWLETWAASHARGNQALVGLPEEHPNVSPIPSPCVAALRACATRNGVTFLCQWDPDAAMAWGTFGAELDHRAHAMTPTLRRLIDQSQGHTYTPWGLNE